MGKLVSHINERKR